MKKIYCKLDGKQSITVPIRIKKNGKLISRDIDIIARGFVKFSKEGNITNNSEQQIDTYQKESASLLDNKTIVYPVVFQSDRVTIENGEGFVTLLPRAEDIIQSSDIIQERTGDEASSNDILNVEASEIFTEEEGYNKSVIFIEKGATRYPYSVSVEITILDDYYYGQTIDNFNSEETFNTNTISSWTTHKSKKPSSNLVIDYYSDIEWVPYVNAPLKDNNATASEILNYLDKLKYNTPFGASPVNDALYKATEILSENDIDDTKKVIYLLTDNESNSSIKTLDEVIEAVNSIDGYKRVPVLMGNLSLVSPVTLSVKVNRSDTRSLNKIGYYTGGQSVTVVDESYEEEILGIFYSQTAGSLGYGTYQFVIDLGEKVLLDNITSFFINVDDENNSNANWKLAYSEDGYTFTSIDNTYKHNETAQLKTDNIYTRYLKFEIVLITGFNNLLDEYKSIPEAPYLDYIEVNYNQSKTSYLYLELQETDFSPSQMVVAVDSSDVDKDQVEIGISSSQSNNWLDYYSDSKFSIEQNGKIIIPLKFNTNTDKLDILEKINRFTVKPRYGRWNPESSIVIYDSDGNVIDSDTYKVYPRKGLIVFSKPLPVGYDNNYKISILDQSSYKIGLKLINKSDVKPLEIYGMSYLYTNNKNLLPPVSKNPPTVQNVVIEPKNPDPYSKIDLSYDYYDVNYDVEDKSQRQIRWYIDGVHVSYLDNLEEWNDIENKQDPLYQHALTRYPSTSDLAGMTLLNWVKSQSQTLVNSQQSIRCEIKVSDGSLYSKQWVSSNTVYTIESSPVVSGVSLKPIDENGNYQDRITANSSVILEYDFSSLNQNKSEIIWYVSQGEGGDFVVFKRGREGDVINGFSIDKLLPGELNINTLEYALVLGNQIYVQIIPQTTTSVGDSLSSDIYTVRNSLPTVNSVVLQPQQPTVDVDLQLTWDFFDFEINVLEEESQSNKTGVKWFRKKAGQTEFKEVYSYNDSQFNFQERFPVDSTDSSYQSYAGNISTYPSGPSSTVSSSVLQEGEEWYAVVYPHDSIEKGTPVKSNTIIIGSSIV